MAQEIANCVQKFECGEKKEAALAAANKNAQILAGLTIGNIKDVLETPTALPQIGENGCGYLVKSDCKLYFYACGQWVAIEIPQNTQYLVTDADGVCRTWAKAKGVLAEVGFKSPDDTILINDPSLPVNDPASADFNPFCNTFDISSDLVDEILMEPEVKPPASGVATVGQDPLNPWCITQNGVVGGTDIGVANVGGNVVVSYTGVPSNNVFADRCGTRLISSPGNVAYDTAWSYGRVNVNGSAFSGTNWVTVAAIGNITGCGGHPVFVQLQGRVNSNTAGIRFFSNFDLAVQIRVLHNNVFRAITTHKDENNGLGGNIPAMVGDINFSWIHPGAVGGSIVTGTIAIQARLRPGPGGFGTYEMANMEAVAFSNATP